MQRILPRVIFQKLHVAMRRKVSIDGQQNDDSGNQQQDKFGGESHGAHPERQTFSGNILCLVAAHDGKRPIAPMFPGGGSRPIV